MFFGAHTAKEAVVQGHLLLIRYHRVLSLRCVYPTPHVTVQIDEIVFHEARQTGAEAFLQSRLRPSKNSNYTSIVPLAKSLRS